LTGTCTFTSDRREYNDCDMVLLHISGKYVIPKYRPRFQKGLFIIFEAPAHSFREISREQWLYNITMTYFA